MINLQEGDIAPDFKGLTEKDKVIKLADYQGKKLVLYFYPKDMTQGCTSEACDLRDNYNKFLNEGYEIIGVSPDTKESHQKFIEKNNLPFSLISDTEKEIIKKYGVWGEKKMYGKSYMGVFRTTFIIDENGRIHKIFNKVKTKEHSNQIFKELSK